MEWVVGVKPMKMKFSGRECAMFQFFVAQEARQSARARPGRGPHFPVRLPAVFPDELHNFLNHKATMHIWAISPTL